MFPSSFVMPFVKGFLLLTVLLLSPDFLAAQVPTFTMEVMGDNNYLQRPWELEFGPDGFLWGTERIAGNIIRIDPETGTKSVMGTVRDVYNDSGQNGLLGLAFHPEYMTDSTFLYVSHTYEENDIRLQRIMRFTPRVIANRPVLANPFVLIDGLPASNDHNSGRMRIGPDGMLYYTIGDQGNNQNRRFCEPIVSQVLPTQEEVDAGNWQHYPGKVLRMTLRGGIPADNPVLNGVQSHVWTYGHRNAQGLVFSADGKLYSSEHGPNSDDELNLITPGGNYGWPIVVGYQDDQAYDYCNWSSLDNCAETVYINGGCLPGAETREESTLTDSNYVDPLYSLFAVDDDFNFNDPTCQSFWICRPNVAPSSLSLYESDAIPAWKNSLLVISLKRGRIYRMSLSEDGTAITGDTTELFNTINRYRDMAIAPDGKTFYVITDNSGGTENAAGDNRTTSLANPGNLLKFTLVEDPNAVETPQEAPFRIWPNPTTDQLFVELGTADQSILQTELIDAAGRVVFTGGQLNTGVNQLSLPELSPGVYFLRMAGHQSRWFKRLVIK